MRTATPIATFLLCVVLPAQAPELGPLTETVDRVVHNLRLDGAALCVLRDAGIVHRSEHGSLGGGSVIPIASASKWLAVATVLTLVDEERLDLDAPVARYLPEFDRPDKANVTLRQCLSCTAGFAARLPRLRNMDMQAFVAAAADAPLRAGPGERFLYGGVGFQVAIAAAERVSGTGFHELFRRRIKEPLGLSDTLFGALQPIGGEPGTTPLPWAGGGAIASLDDYAGFVRMLLAKGRCGDRQVLSEASVAEMFRDQVPNLVEVHGEGLSGEVRYGLGTWIVTLADGGRRVCDPGAFGFTPWLDLDLGVGGVFAVRDRVRRLLPHIEGLMDAVREVARSPVVAGVDSTIDLDHGGRLRRYRLHVPAKVADGQGAPLVLVLHGGGGTGELAMATTRFADLADRAGFVVAFPDGTGALRHRLLTWNSGGIPVYAVDHDIDDTGFLRAVVGDIAGRIAIDPARIYAVGHSNGGMMCHRLAREAADLFAGVAVVAGAMNFTAADSELPIGVLIIHGTGDRHVGFRGGEPELGTGRAGSRSDASVQDAIDYYLARNGLHGYPETAIEPQDGPEAGKVRVDTWGKTRDGAISTTPLRLITLAGGGHAWPGADPQTSVSDRPFDYDATAAIWRFFQITHKRLTDKAVVDRTPSSPR